MPSSAADPENSPSMATDEWNLRFLAEMGQILAERPGTEFDSPGAVRYRVEELALTGGFVRLVWAFPGAPDTGKRSVRVGRFMNLVDLRGGFSPDDPDIVAGAVLLNDFYPAHPPAEDREHADGIRWLGPPPP